MSNRATGIALAFITAVISGVSIYVNSLAVKHFTDQTVYTTAKNGVAGLPLLLVLWTVRRRSERPRRQALPPARVTAPALIVLAVVGGSVPFVLFFEGLAKAQATQAAFIQKTLIIWVAILAVPLLRERFRVPHALAIALLIAGQVWLIGSAGKVVFGQGEAMILGATLLWGVEVVYVKRLLGDYDSHLLAAARMALGTVLLLVWLALTGKLTALTALTSGQWRWVALTGVLLTGYVATWYAALARAQAIDVTAVLVFGVVITAVLAGTAGVGTLVSVPGVLLIVAGSALVALTAIRTPAGVRRTRNRLVSSPKMMPAVPGPLLFARYAYPPNALGLCGADTPRTLLEYGDARASDLGLAEVARTFEGAWPYLTLIAGCNGIGDPLDARVVEAYWVGNELLSHVRADELARHVDERFRGRIGRAEEHVLDVVAAGAAPHHCFHVFAVYPWLGRLRSGIVEQPLQVLDQCRTTPAVVHSAGEDGMLTVLARPLLWEGGSLRLGESAPRDVRWRTDGLAFVDRPQPGDHVSLHWDFVCDRLTPAAARALLRANQMAIGAVNRAGTAAALS